MEFFEFDNSFLSKGGSGYGEQHSALKSKDDKGTIITQGGRSAGSVTCAESEFYKANNLAITATKPNGVRSLVNCVDNMPYQTATGKGSFGKSTEAGNAGFSKGAKF